MINGHYYQNAVSASLLANERKTVTIQLEADSGFIIKRMYAINTGVFSTIIRDSAINYSWSNYPVNNANLYGTPQFPAVLQDPFFLPPSTEIQFELQDLSGNPNTIQIVFEGYRSYVAQPVEKKRLFTYVKDFVIAPSDLLSDTLQSNSDSDFVIKKLMATYGTAQSAMIKYNMSTLGGRNLQNQFVNLDNIFGSAVLPNILPDPITMEPLAIMQFTLQNLIPFVNTIQVAFEGLKIWR